MSPSQTPMPTKAINHWPRQLLPNTALHSWRTAAQAKTPRARSLTAFADLATAKACYASPEYQAARQQRLAAAVVMITIVEGL
jgi:Domain of unknown function (DUF1330)